MIYKISHITIIHHRSCFYLCIMIFNESKRFRLTWTFDYKS